MDETEDTPNTEAAAESTATAEPETGEAPPVKLRQEVDIRDTGPCKKHIKVTVNREDIDVRLDEKYSELVTGHRSFVQGFRPGKAPRKLVDGASTKRKSTDQVRGEILMASLEQLAEEQDIAPLAPPELDPAKIVIPPEGPMIYEFEVEVRPQFQLPNYKGLKLKRPVQDFTDADVAKEKRRLLEPYGQLVPERWRSAGGRRRRFCHVRHHHPARRAGAEPGQRGPHQGGPTAGVERRRGRRFRQTDGRRQAGRCPHGGYQAVRCRRECESSRPNDQGDVQHPRRQDHPVCPK